MLLWISTVLASEASASIPINTPQTIDFSILDSIAGAVIAIAVMIVVGFFLVKYGIVKVFGVAPGVDRIECGVSSERDLRREDRLEMKAEVHEALSSIRLSINELRDDMRNYLREQQECQRMLPEKYVQWEAFNRLMAELKQDRKERWEKFDMHTHSGEGGPQFLRKIA